jgi:predicted nucleotidyltransferase
MSKNLLKNTRFKREIKFFFKKNNEILDIILFGSSIKGKDKPNDIDLLIIYKTKKDLDTSYELRKKLNKLGFNVSISDKTYKTLIDGNFKPVEEVFSEGYSLIYDKFIANGIGYFNLSLFKYNLKPLNKSQRMRFYYSLYGRDKKGGIVKEFNLIKFSDTLLLCPTENMEKLKEFFESWKIETINFPIMIPSRLKFII